MDYSSHTNVHERIWLRAAAPGSAWSPQKTSQNSPVWWCHSWIHHGFLSTPKIPLRSPGLEAEHVTLCWGVFINIYMFLFTFTVIEKGSCTTWRAQEEAEGRRRGRKKRYGLEGGTFQRSQGAPKEGRNVCIYSERQPWDEGGIEEGEEKERVRGWRGEGGGGCEHGRRGR